MLDFLILSLSSHFVSLSICELLSTFTLSLSAGGWTFMPMDRWGFFFFFFFVCVCDRCLKEDVGMAEVGYGSWFFQVRCC